MVKVNGFEKALAMAEIKEQQKTKVKNAKKAYIADLMAQGLDRAIAKALADAEFEYELVRAM